MNLLLWLACVYEPVPRIVPELEAVALEADGLKGADLVHGGAILEGSRQCMAYHARSCWSLETDLEVYEPPNSSLRCVYFEDADAAELTLSGQDCTGDDGEPLASFGQDRLAVDILDGDAVEGSVISWERAQVAYMLQAYPMDGYSLETHGPELFNPPFESRVQHIRIWPELERFRPRPLLWDDQGGQVSWASPWRLDLPGARDEGDGLWRLDPEQERGAIVVTSGGESLQVGRWSRLDKTWDLRTRLHVWVMSPDDPDAAELPLVGAWYELVDSLGNPVVGAPVQYSLLGAGGTVTGDSPVWNLECAQTLQGHSERVTVTARLGAHVDTEAFWVWVPPAESEAALAAIRDSYACGGGEEEASGCASIGPHRSGLLGVLLLIAAALRRRGQAGAAQVSTPAAPR